MSESAPGIRGIRTLPSSAELTSAEIDWVQAEAAVGRFVHDETPTGAVNGSNTSFTLVNSPKAGTLIVYEGSRRLILTTDFTLSGSTITMTYAPPTGSYIRCDYRY